MFAVGEESLGDRINSYHKIKIVFFFFFLNDFLPSLIWTCFSLICLIDVCLKRFVWLCRRKLCWRGAQSKHIFGELEIINFNTLFRLISECSCRSLVLSDFWCSCEFICCAIFFLHLNDLLYVTCFVSWHIRWHRRIHNYLIWCYKRLDVNWYMVYLADKWFDSSYIVWHLVY